MQAAEGVLLCVLFTAITGQVWCDGGGGGGGHYIPSHTNTTEFLPDIVLLFSYWDGI